jgi:hypothetical protein
LAVKGEKIFLKKLRAVSRNNNFCRECQLFGHRERPLISASRTFLPSRKKNVPARAVMSTHAAVMEKEILRPIPPTTRMNLDATAPESQSLFLFPLAISYKQYLRSMVT